MATNDWGDDAPFKVEYPLVLDAIGEIDRASLQLRNVALLADRAASPAEREAVRDELLREMLAFQDAFLDSNLLNTHIDDVRKALTGDWHDPSQQ